MCMGDMFLPATNDMEEGRDFSFEVCGVVLIRFAATNIIFTVIAMSPFLLHLNVTLDYLR